MSRLKALLFVGCILACASVPRESKAFALTLGGDFWDISSSGGGGSITGNGVGGNIYPQWSIAYGISAELQIGFHWMKPTFGGVSSGNLAYVPLMVGARFDLSKVLPLGIIAPFVAAHIGYAGTEDWGGGGLGGTNSLGYSFNVGTTFSLGDLGVGVQGGYDIFSNSGLTYSIPSVAAILQL